MSPLLEVEEGVEGVPVPVVDVPVMLDEEGLLDRETTGGMVCVASRSLPAASARIGSNVPFYTRSVRHVQGKLVECAYGIIQVRPMRD